MLDDVKILDKTYTPRDLWETLERVTQLEIAIRAHQAGKEGEGDAGDRRLWRKVENLWCAKKTESV